MRLFPFALEFGLSLLLKALLMQALPELDHLRHVYRKRLGPRIGYVVIGILGSALGVWIFHLPGTVSLAARWLLSGFMVFNGFAVMLYGVRTRVVLYGTRISASGAFFTRSADMSEIAGYRYEATRQSKTPRIYLNNGRRSILVETELDIDDYFLRWFRQIPELGERAN